MIRKRIEESANYSAVFVNGKTIRIPLDRTKPITELRYPEFYDLSFGNKCVTGKCDYCYASASKTGTHYKNIVQKIDNFFGIMDINQRPTQVAVGGSQEPLEHPEFWDAMIRLFELQICPNFTTNGVIISNKIIENTLKYCGGVAVTLHPHLEKFWRKAIPRYAEAKTKLNLHVIISDKESIDVAKSAYKEYVSTNLIDYLVLLPYKEYGHAIDKPKTIDYLTLERWLDEIYSEGKIAFGAYFYDFIKQHAVKYDVSLYSPEILSKYCQLTDSIQISNNSFDKKPVKFIPGFGCELTPLHNNS